MAYGFPRCFLPDAGDPAHSGVGFSHLPGPSKQLRQDLGGRSELDALFDTGKNPTHKSPCFPLL